MERVVDCPNNGLVGFIEFGPRQENLPHVIPLEAEYGLELAVREEGTLYGCSQTLSYYLTFSLVQIG